MQRFYGSWVARFTMLLIGLCGLGSTYFFLYTPISRGMSGSSTGDSMLVAAIPISIGFLLEGLVCLLGLVESFTVYTLDEEKIVKRAVYGTSEMAWKTITDIKTGGRQAIVTALTDDAGRRMRLVPMLIRDGDRLRVAIEEYLKGLREKQTQELGWQAKTYRPGRNISYLLFALVAILALCGFALLGNPHVKNPPSLQLVGVLTFLVPVVAGALLALYLFTWTITIAPGLISTSGLFFRKTIPYHQIEAVMVRDIPVKNGTMNETTVIGAGQKIKFNEMMPDYALVRDYIQAQAGKEAVARGEAEVSDENKKWLRSQMIQITLISLIAGGGLAAFFISMAHQRLEVWNRLDNQGAHAVGRITGTHTSGSKSTTYLIDYTFTVNGQNYRHASPVSQSDYEAAQPDRPIEVIYLPNDPNMNRAQQSIGRKEAESTLHIAYWMLAIIFVLPPVAYFDLRQRLKKKQAVKGKS